MSTHQEISIPLGRYCVLPLYKHHFWMSCASLGTSGCAFWAHFFSVVSTLSIGSPLMLSVPSQRPAVFCPPLSPWAYHCPLTSFICNTRYSALQLLAPAWPTNVGWIELDFHGSLPSSLDSHVLCTVALSGQERTWPEFKLLSAVLISFQILRELQSRP